MTQKKPPVELDMEWKGGMRFQAVDGQGVTLHLDGDGQRGFSPMKGLLASLCGCMAIDVVMILQKMRLPLRGLEVSARGIRNDTEPRYFKRLSLDFRFSGEVPQEKAERAVRLSFDKYCSVFHTLRDDIDVSHSITVES
ncbi:MAG TPA: OsmC family protein [Acidobacteriota bacterium]|nr:OsmC family protein [Acidobacteriota bacterium]